MKKIALLALFLTPLASAQIARADATEEARKHFNRAVALVDDGQLDGALVEFQRSYDLTHHFAVLYNIGQVLVSLARPVEAFDVYQRYLAEGRAVIPAARRIEVENEMLRQKARIATLDIRGLPDGASVRVDGKELGKVPIPVPLRVGVGKHVIAATAEGYAPATSEVTVAGEDHRVVNLMLARNVVVPLAPAPPMTPVAAAQTAPIAPAAPVVPAAGGSLAVDATAATPASQPMSKLRIAGIVVGAVGVAGLAAGAGFWFAAKSRHDDALNANDSDRPRAESLQSEAEHFVTATNVSLAAGGTLVALGVAAFLLGAPAKPATGTGAQAYVLPSVGPGIAGIGAGGVW